MKQMKYLATFTLILALALMFFGCAKPPEAEQKAAKSAMEAAISAGADKYAVADMEAATKIFDTAEAQVKDKKYDEAKKVYGDAKAAFEKAAAGVEAGKKVVAGEATAAVAAIEASWKELQASAKKVEKAMKEKKEDWDAEVKSFEEGLKAGKEMLAADPAGAKAKMEELKGVIEKWSGEFKEMAAAPAAPEPKKEKKSKK